MPPDCDACGQTLPSIDLAAGTTKVFGQAPTLFEGLVCLACGKVECSRCLGGDNRARCRWCDGRVKPAYAHYLLRAPDFAKTCWFCEQNPSAPDHNLHVRLVATRVPHSRDLTPTETAIPVPRCQSCSVIHWKAVEGEKLISCCVGGVAALGVIILGIRENRFWLGLMMAPISFGYWLLLSRGLLGLRSLPKGVKRLRHAKRHPEVASLVASSDWEIQSLDQRAERNG
jgi:hypothetical protein